ncbi:MAG: hypothetical protein ACLP62_04985 [Acidimicrobiales bacterium]
MSVRQRFAERMAVSVWGRWSNDDDEALASARGERRRRGRRRTAVPAEVLALLTIADPRQMVLDLPDAVDGLGSGSGRAYRARPGSPD